MSENIYQKYAESARAARPDESHVPFAVPIETTPPQPLSPSKAARRDACAVGSAVCGFTGFIPILTQVIGLTLGIIAMVRVGRARRSGVEIKGMRDAVVGLTMNGLTLVGWIGLFAAMSIVGTSLSGTTDQLTQLLSYR